LAEGAGAAALAAALQEKPKLRGKRVGLVLSGGNIDFDLFKEWVMDAHASMSSSGSTGRFSTPRPDSSSQAGVVTGCPLSRA
jgi:threonine dehydratase